MRWLYALMLLTALTATACGTCETNNEGETQCEEWSLPPQR